MTFIVIVLGLCLLDNPLIKEFNRILDYGIYASSEYSIIIPMDFLDPAKKKAHRIRLYTGYFLIAVAIMIATTVLVFISYGFDWDRKTGAVIQNGLVFLDAHPESADIYINGSLHKSRTDTRIELPAGQYTVELKRPGYRQWQRSINLEGGSIERLVYPVLFPENLVTNDSELYASQPTFATASPDRHWLVVLHPGTLTAFDVFDLNSENVPNTIINLPDGLLTASPEPRSIVPVEWSTDNRHLLIKHTFNNQQEFIMIDRENPSLSFNINRLFSVAPTEVVLRDKRFDRLYIYNGASGLLQAGEVRQRTITPILNQVLAFKPHGDDQLLYITDMGATAGKVSANILDGTKTYKLKELIAGAPYMVDMARFDGRWYVVAGSNKEHKAYIYRDPLDDLKRENTQPLVPVSILKVDNPENVSFSDNTRFIAVQGGSRMGVYDAEMDKRFFYDVKAPLQAGAKVHWMDGHRLTVLSEGKVVVFDFDGINQQTLEPSAFRPFFNRDYTALYTLSSSKTVPSRSALLRTELKLR